VENAAEPWKTAVHRERLAADDAKFGPQPTDKDRRWAGVSQSQSISPDTGVGPRTFAEFPTPPPKKKRWTDDHLSSYPSIASTANCNSTATTTATAITSNRHHQFFFNCTQRRSSSVLPTQVHGTSLLKFNTSLIIQFRDCPIYFTMPAPTRLLQPTEGAENVSVPVVAEQDDELLLDIQDVNPADPNAIAPPPTSEDTEMVVDEEGRPRFAPGKDVVRCGTGLRMRRKKAIFNKILVNCF